MPARTVCAQPGCPRLTTTRRCDEHTRQTDRARGTRPQRGYGTEHDATRARLLPAAYGQPCPVCQQPMLPGQRLDAGHSEDLRDNPEAKADRIEHASCNRGWRGRQP